MTQNINAAILGPDLEELVFGAVPLIEHLLHEILVIIQLKTDRSFICFATGVTLNVQHHQESVSLMRLSDGKKLRRMVGRGRPEPHVHGHYSGLGDSQER
jgi:hypothetical protein